ncbi:type 1 glutamine amidotransferase [Actinokineospora sp. NBRC 105648]|uniref:type 1 glutamine amidotransferase n=1 Tax=Actinokineospora sp. NBRC 105648 TaxID=3032206 RepID=UPI0024A37477|nr:type 1 glutamine amidotransferase [Actinokineospora sp. NBRC 105648]GLZ41656.1 glutamine amidotransferase [Actinokineospora sp. NBRC 105648]
MTSARILVVQLSDLDPPGRLVEWLADAGAEIDLAHPYRDPLPPSPAGYSAVVCLGGPMGANDVIAHPWLVDVRRLLSTCVSGSVPVLAVCLGAQLLAVATGGQVEVGDKGPEVGSGLVAKRDLGWADPLFADLPLMPDVVQFHSDTVTRLPVDAALLASATKYPNQAFRVGRVGYGIQFHIETTAEIVLDWARNAPETAGWARPGDLEPDRLAELHADVEETWRPFVDRFVRLARGELAPVDTGRPQLPMI